MFQWLQQTTNEEVITPPTPTISYEKTIDEIEQEFNEKVRVNVIVLLMFISLYVFSYFLLLHYHTKRERHSWLEDDAKVHRISLHLCALTVSNSFGAILMLPMSMIGNEVVHLYPHSYLLQWLNGALIHTIWELIFMISNASLFILIPFSYLFTESEGLSGHRPGLLARFYETITVLCLFLIVTFSSAMVFMAFFEKDDSYFNIMKLVSQFYLSTLYALFLYGWMLFTLTACTPGGLTLIFDKVGSLLVKPKIFGDNEEKIQQIRLIEDSIKRKLKNNARRLSAQDSQLLTEELDKLRSERVHLERQKKVSSLHRNVCYPCAMLALLILTGLSLFLVTIHILKLLFVGDHELHPSTVRDEYGNDYRNPMKQMNVCRQMDENGDELPEFCHQIWNKESGVPADHETSHFNSHLYSLGANSLSMFGIVGTLLEVLVILFIFVGSLVGLYNLPGFRKLLPQVDNTSITIIIINCLIFQLLACSLPVLSRVLGITDFELQGNFGKLDWLGNFPSIFLFNLIFAIETCLCLATKFTHKMQQELCKALRINRGFVNRILRRANLTFSSNKAFSPQNHTDDDDSSGNNDVTGPTSTDDVNNNNNNSCESASCDSDTSLHDKTTGEATSSGNGQAICSPAAVTTSASLTLISALSPFRVFGASANVPVVARH